MRNLVLIATDSRGKDRENGKGLEVHVKENFPTNTELRTYIKGGHEFEDLAEWVIRVASRENQRNPTTRIIIIISAGICNLTERIAKTHNTHVRYHRNQNNIERLKRSVAEFVTSCTENGLLLVLTTIYPVDLQAAAEHYCSTGQLKRRNIPVDIPQQQVSLEQDLADINGPTTPSTSIDIC
jgi:hypothetical protein